MRGAETVNDEFEVGFNQTFESRWYRAERAGRVVVGALRLQQVRYAVAERDGKISIVQGEA